MIMLIFGFKLLDKLQENPGENKFQDIICQ